MISSKLTGGLGNQMFQIAAAHALAILNNDQSCFDFDSCYTPLQGKPSNHYIYTIFKKINKKCDKLLNKQYYENDFSYSEIPYESNLILNGYFQSEKYFIDVKEEIINLFNISDYDKDIVNEVLSLNEIKSKTSVHIRRGDYLKFPEIHKTCDVDYYKKAMSMFEDTTFIFISDDIPWVKNNFVGDNIIYSPFNDDIIDLTLMSMCDNNIIANSTFSWWGAYLNQNKNKKIIAPNKWFSENSKINESDIIPNDWVKI